MWYHKNEILIKKEVVNLNKKTILITILAILLIAVSSTIYSSFSKKNDTTHDYDLEPTKIETLKKALLDYPDFAKSKITTDKDKNTLMINDKYEIVIKNGYYSMTIKNLKLESDYCRIVDAIEVSLGTQAGKSIETCEKTLAGKINLGGISADLYDTYKVLTVNSEEASTLFDPSKSHKEREIISKDEINYNITIDDYLFTSMSANYTTDNKTLKICGNVIEEKDNKDKTFTITTYDKDKKELDKKNYKYENTTNKYVPFCVDYIRELDDVKYYSIDYME